MSFIVRRIMNKGHSTKPGLQAATKFFHLFLQPNLLATNSSCDVQSGLFGLQTSLLESCMTRQQSELRNATSPIWSGSDLVVIE